MLSAVFSARYTIPSLHAEDAQLGVYYYYYSYYYSYHHYHYYYYYYKASVTLQPSAARIAISFS